MDNKLRLKQVKNLDELINFKIKTVSDNMIDEGTLINDESRKKGLHALRKVVDPLLTSKAFPATVTKTKDYRLEAGGSSVVSKHIMEDDDEDSLLQLEQMSGTYERQPSDGELSQDLVHEAVEGITKKVERKLMSETGTILIERKTVTD